MRGAVAGVAPTSQLSVPPSVLLHRAAGSSGIPCATPDSGPRSPGAAAIRWLLMALGVPWGSPGGTQDTLTFATGHLDSRGSACGKGHPRVTPATQRTHGQARGPG